MSLAISQALGRDMCLAVTELGGAGLDYMREQLERDPIGTVGTVKLSGKIRRDAYLPAFGPFYELVVSLSIQYFSKSFLSSPWDPFI